MNKEEIEKFKIIPELIIYCMYFYGRYGDDIEPSISVTRRFSTEAPQEYIEIVMGVDNKSGLAIYGKEKKFYQFISPLYDEHKYFTELDFSTPYSFAAKSDYLSEEWLKILDNEKSKAN